MFVIVVPWAEVEVEDLVAGPRTRARCHCLHVEPLGPKGWGAGAERDGSSRRTLRGCGDARVRVRGEVPWCSGMGAASLEVHAASRRT